MRPVAVGWIAERIDCSAGGTGSTFAGTDLTAGAIGSIAEGIDSTFGDIDLTFAGTGSIVVATGWIAEGIDSIVVDIGSTFVGTDLTAAATGLIAEGTDSTFGDIGSTPAGIGSIVVVSDSIVGGIDLILAASERGFHCSSGYNFGFDGNFVQMKLLGQSQRSPVLHILHTRIQRYWQSSKSHSSFDLVRLALEDGMI